MTEVFIKVYYTGSALTSGIIEVEGKTSDGKTIVVDDGNGGRWTFGENLWCRTESEAISRFDVMREREREMLKSRLVQLEAAKPTIVKHEPGRIYL